jgi:beta-glucosidase
MKNQKMKRLYKNICLATGLFLMGLAQVSAQQTLKQPNVVKVDNPQKNAEATDKMIEDLIQQMTLEEKVGQLNFNFGVLFSTGPTQQAESYDFEDLIRQGKTTGVFNTYKTEFIRKLQKMAVEESRLKIPLLIGADVIHGFRTVFPIPLAEAASWDLKAIQKSAEIAALEATASGINYTFAPMVDICRDPRWGRIAEGAGEDPFLGSRIAEARVRGFQGTDLKSPYTMAACVKHFAAYGASEAGRDYNTVDMSERLLREVYLPPYKAAVDAGSATVMTSFNELDGVPASGNKFLLDQILRKEWGFKGMVVSDWQSILEMKTHGIGGNDEYITKLAIEAGTDMDMEGDLYLEVLPKLVQQGKVKQEVVDGAVRRVLKLKADLGLFDNPYLYCDSKREKKEVFSKENQAVALDVAKRCIVLLKNENQLLPLKKDTQTIAVIGPLANNKSDLNGTWSFFGDANEPITILEGIKNKVAPKTQVLYAQGCEFYTDSQKHFEEAIKIAQQADVVVLALGESAVMNGEGGSLSSLTLPAPQMALLQAIHQTGKPIVVLVNSGRPLCIEWLDENIPAILETWTLGTQTGNAIAEVLFGDYNPSGKLPVTFPRNVGQIPIYYNHKNTGRPYLGDYTEPQSERVYFSKYRDVKNTPLYPFGYGLSYTTFAYSDLQLDKTKIKMGEKLKVTAKVSNIGKYDGEEVVQWYLRDMAGSVTRPVKELKGFEKIFLKAGESKTVSFEITQETLSFYRQDMSWGTEAGSFKMFVGTSSDNVLETNFELVEFDK